MYLNQGCTECNELNCSVSTLNTNLWSRKVSIQMIHHSSARQLQRHCLLITTSSFHLEFWILFSFSLSVSLLFRFLIGDDQCGFV